MQNIDFRSVLIGVLSSALIFTLYGMRFQDENLGDIRVKSIRIDSGENSLPFVVLNKNNLPAMSIGISDEGNGVINIFSDDLVPRVAISTTQDGDFGFISTFSKSGSELIALSATIEGCAISIFNRHNKRIVGIQGNNNADGVIQLYDRYGDMGWQRTGIK